MKKRVIEFERCKYGFKFYWINLEKMMVRFAFTLGFFMPTGDFKNTRDFIFELWINRPYLPHKDTSLVHFKIKNVFSW